MVQAGFIVEAVYPPISGPEGSSRLWLDNQSQESALQSGLLSNDTVLFCCACCRLQALWVAGSRSIPDGDKIIELLSERLMQAGVSRSEARELGRYLKCYLTYPSIR